MTEVLVVASPSLASNCLFSFIFCGSFFATLCLFGLLWFTRLDCLGVVNFWRFLQNVNVKSIGKVVWGCFRDKKICT